MSAFRRYFHKTKCMNFFTQDKKLLEKKYNLEKSLQHYQKRICHQTCIQRTISQIYKKLK